MMAFITSGLRMQKAMPSNIWPVANASTTAVRKPEMLVQNIDSCMVGTGFSPASGFSSLVPFLTLSWRPPVTASINSEKPIKARPSVESSPPFFFLLPNRLKTHTPMVSSNTCTYSSAENVLPPITRPPAITGTSLHDLPSTCVANETYRRASLEPAIASICDVPEMKMSFFGMMRPELPNKQIPSSPMPALTPRSATSARKVYLKYSPPYVFL
mmetsp:Transcript_63579/g.168077  ORF Transcript_63579/g.168077 Transcript_63579/m.168077 type:complete len:214 (+) Transcript_63579:951-1592(+)